ncbi:MAG: excinuclease ABC subunit UvrA [Rikenellaceae bacterium]|nr:excinuclease ABC subunit UvrA [Rikenellaceae bacterium]
MADKIEIRGARVHNLKNIDVTIPHNQLVVITGLSGSGKSTLAFDTIFAEGRRRYVESLSAYARQFLGRLEKPDVDYIDGIAPAIAIEQKVSSRNPRSTVGTTTEIYDYLKLLFSRVGHTFSPVSGREVKCYSTDDVVEYVLSLGEGSRVVIASPLRLKEGQGIIERLTLLLGDGIQRVWIDGVTEFIEDFVPRVTDSTRAEDISIIIDRRRVASDTDSLTTLGDSVSKAFAYGDGVCQIITEGEVREFSSRFEMDGVHFEQPSEHLFSFNNPIGACPMCEGYGRVVGIDENLVVPDKTKSIYEGAVVCWRGETMGWWRQQLVDAADVSGFPIHRPYYKLSRAEKRLLWTGCEWFHGLDEFFKYLESQRYKVQYRVLLSRYTGKTLCPECEGGRLRKEATYVKVGGRSIPELVSMTVGELDSWFESLSLGEHDTAKSTRIVTEIRNRLRCLCDVGLEYLTLDRLSSTLSGGESQRINLSQQLGSCLVGSLYILDEPSIGLHPRDTDRLIKVLKGLRDLGNTVIVVEHDAEIMRAADRIIDMGPLAGVHGGEVVCNDTFEKVLNCPDSLTADYLTGRRSIARPAQVRGWSHSVLLRGVLEHNLKGFDVRIPLGVMTCVTGVSGSGKSSLVKGILYPALRRRLHESGDQPGELRELAGDVGLLTAVEMVDQNPIGKSTRSNPVTYIKAYDEIRKLFAEQPFAKHTGMTPAYFSFNTPGGRCEECQGEGIIKVGMQFMADVELTCQACGGHRFKDEVLEVKYRDCSIYDVLEMSVDRAVEFFGDDKSATAKRIVERLKALQSVGLGYVKLGQSSSTLSGGESQRVKLASFLLKDSSSEHIMFIFDEPTTGLHFHDINKLLGAFDALIRRGHTVVVVEHNMDVVKCADWVIDLGPEGGDAGGNLVFEGRPEDLIGCAESHTAQYLKPLMKN